MKDALFSVGWHKHEMDFGVSGAVGDLTYEQMKRAREMIVVGIWVFEDTWRRAQELKDMPQVTPPHPRPMKENL